MHGLVYRYFKPLGLIAALVILWAPAAKGATINVPGDFQTIQDAVDNADPGDEIVLLNGTYNESVSLNNVKVDPVTGKSDITVRSQDPLLPAIVKGVIKNGEPSSAFYAEDFKGNIIIRNLNLDAVTDVNAVLNFKNVAGSVVLQDNVFSEYPGDGVAFEVSGGISSRIELRGNDFTMPIGDGDGLNVSIAGNPTVDLIIDGNNFEGMQASGIKTSVSSTGETGGPVIAARIVRNILKGVLQKANAIDIDLGDRTTSGTTASLLIEDNEIYDAGFDYLDKSISLKLDGSDAVVDVIIRGSVIDNSVGTAIFIGGEDGASNSSANILINNNEITNSQYNGIEIISPISLTMEPVFQKVVCKDNRVTNPYGYGFFVGAYHNGNYFNLNLDLEYNTVENSTYGGYAFYLVDGNKMQVEQGLSSSTVLSEVISDNSNLGTLGYVFGNITVMPDAVTADQVPAVLGGFIWNDVDGNGSQNGSEEIGLWNIPVELTGTTNLGGAVNWFTASDASGTYMFPALLPGAYTLKVTPPSIPNEYTFSPKFLESIGSDPDVIFDSATGMISVSFTVDKPSFDVGLWAPDPRLIDDDDDGFTEEAGDCNDSDPAVSPEGVEICGDDIDQNCDGADLLCPEDVDDDWDGFTENQGDCNDSDDTIHPDATEICGDGIDQNCDGSDEACEVETVPTISDLQLMVTKLKTSKWKKYKLNYYLRKAQRAFDKGHVKQGRKRIVTFMKKLTNQSNYKWFGRRRIAREDADKLIMAAAEMLTGQPAAKTYSIADIGSMVAGLNTRYRTKASLSYRLFAADWAARLGFHRFSRNLLIGFIDKAVNCCDYRGRKSSHRISIEESNQLIMAGASALANLPWK